MAADRPITAVTIVIIIIEADILCFPIPQGTIQSGRRRPVDPDDALGRIEFLSHIVRHVSISASEVLHQKEGLASPAVLPWVVNLVSALQRDSLTAQFHKIGTIKKNI